MSPAMNIQKTSAVLPNEILLYILLLVCGWFSEDPCTFYLRRHFLMEIDAYWKTLIGEDIHFWKGIFIDRDSRVQDVCAAVERSKESQVHIYIAPGHSEPEDPFNADWDIRFRLLAGALDPIMNRCRQLTLKTSELEIDPVVLWLVSLPTTSLQTLNLQMLPGTLFCSMVTSIGHSLVARGGWGWTVLDPAPSRYRPLRLLPNATITSLSIQHSFVLFEPAFLHGVTHLRLGPILEDILVSWDNICDLLQSCLPLTFLFLDDVRCKTQCADFRTCFLPRLTHLRLFAVHECCTRMLPAFDLPSLRVLDFEAATQPDQADAVSLLTCQRFLARVQHLTLSVDVPFAQALVAELQPLAAMCHLDMRYSNPVTVLALEHLADCVGGPLCPQLRTIHLSAKPNPQGISRILNNRVQGHFHPNCVLSYDFTDGIKGRTRVSYCAGSDTISTVDYVELPDGGIESREIFLN
ncbi:hypothetical protein R3P38DRAFT_3237043 [Favolaschia claudopus]|uniref:F-box domain-containing protein n=1 Tax=Favolaschia claudopus TaxID=2862362 RepID=A0AAV9ZC93_9AGAR